MTKRFIGAALAVLLLIGLVPASAQDIRRGMNTGVIPFTLTGNNLTTTSTDGIVLQNTTAALVGTQVQFSPRIRLTGTGWDLNDSVSRTIKQVIEMQPVANNEPFGAFTIKELEPSGDVTRLAYIQSFGGTAPGSGALIYNTAIGGDALISLNSTGRYNSAFGLHSGFNTSSGIQNNYFGVNAGYVNTIGQDNNFFGVEAGKSNLSGSGNVAMGTNAGWSNSTGGSNVAIGSSACYNALAGSNTCVGSSAGFTSAGSGNVFIGFDAGSYETGSSKFMVNNQDRTNEAGDRTKSLLYGVFNATASSQTLVTNAVFSSTYGYQLNGVDGIGALTHANPANQTGNATATLKMNGLGAAGAPCVITPVGTGRVIFTITGDLLQNTTADGISYKLVYGTGAAPANAAAATGTVISAARTWTALTGMLQVPFTITASATALAKSTALWFDLQIADITGGTAAVINIDCTANEI